MDLLQCLGLKMAILYFRPAEFLCSRVFQSNEELVGNFFSKSKCETCEEAGKLPVDVEAFANESASATLGGSGEILLL